MPGRFPYRVRAARDRSRPTVTHHSAETGGEGRRDGRRHGGGSAWGIPRPRPRCRSRRAPSHLPARPGRCRSRLRGGRERGGSSAGTERQAGLALRLPSLISSTACVRLPPHTPTPAAVRETPSSFWKRDFYGGRGGHSKHAQELAAVQALPRQKSPAAWFPLHAITPTAAVRQEHTYACLSTALGPDSARKPLIFHRLGL